ncbi:ferritin-like domain-containing protein [Roseobacter sp.]|uniref:ferritin-like domain-containing protein n=1 Tax=Roseobacter sp. TaxID=1907202 RepID=UPI0025E753E7|nr:ferritin-like domain-containing protein [Roseobacter sp.]
MAPDDIRSSTKKTSDRKAPEVSWRDHLVMLLNVGAEIEHGLMVQYLYSAYSIDTRGHPPEVVQKLESWRDHILTIAREEMGHFITVQNLLRLLGAPMNLARQNFPWDVDYYPFPFRLEPFSLSSVAAYAFTEAPPLETLETDAARQTSGGKRIHPAMANRYIHYKRFDYDEIRRRVDVRMPRNVEAHSVDVIYSEIIDLLKDEDRIPDSVFQEDTYSAQANWDDWGRRYRPAPKMLTADGSPAEKQAKDDIQTVNETNMLVMPVGTRTEAIKALQLVSEQGEAPHMGTAELEEISHFDRFLVIFQDLKEMGDDFRPARDVASNPSVRKDVDGSTQITHPRTRSWAKFANIRYRMLLAFLGHRLKSGAKHKVPVQDRETMLIHRTFAEMYNIKTVSNLLMQMPLGASGEDAARFAGPPFETPFDLRMPYSEVETWMLHRELVKAAIRQATELLDASDDDDTAAAYLRTQLPIDRQTLAWTEAILSGLGVTKGQLT